MKDIKNTILEMINHLLQDQPNQPGHPLVGARFKIKPNEINMLAPCVCRVGKCPKESPNTPINERKVREMGESEEHNFIW